MHYWLDNILFYHIIRIEIVRTVAAFDFDGTITRKDTLLEFIKFSRGKKAFYMGFLSHLPMLLAYRIGLYPNWKAKQVIMKHFFKGEPLNEFNLMCEEFFKVKGEWLLYKSAVTKIQEYLAKGIEVIIITASAENWVSPFARYLGVKFVAGTKMEIDRENRITGKFLTANCYGKEKVNRILELFPERTNYYLVVYGDSKGDKELLEIANESYYKLFNL